MAIPLRSEEVPKDFICAICISLPLVPCIVKRCSHVFCQGCINASLSHLQSCPVCRLYCTKADVLPLEYESSLSYRIWSNIAVKCEHHAEGCGWTGSLLDYRSHHNPCSRTENAPQRNRDKEVIQKLKAENEDVNQRLSFLTITKEELETRVRRLKRENRELEEERDKIKNSIEKLDCNERGGYTYDRTSVVKLTKLICQNLENKPDSIDSNKIFHCVKNILSDLVKRHSDNPTHLRMDVCMLLAVCNASTWFTIKQRNRVEDMTITAMNPTL